MESNNSPPDNPGHTKISGHAGAVHFLAASPGQALAQVLWQRGDRGGDRVADGFPRARTRRDPRFESPHFDDDLRRDLLGARQAIRIGRWRRPTGQAARIESVHYLTNLTPQAVSPAHIAQLTRGHWSIENRLHHMRDTAWNEDQHHTRIGQAPPNLTVLRNIANTLHRRAGVALIRPALRAVTRYPERLLVLLRGNRQNG